MVRSFAFAFIAVSLVIFALARGTNAQTTVFTYQGSLKSDAAPASGNYDFEFSLFDAVSGGMQIGSTLTRNAVAVSAGVFSVNLDFGANFPGANRYLEIRLKQTGGGALTLLSPRNQINSTPYAIRALTVTGPLSGTTPTATLTVTNDQPGITNPSPTILPPAALKAEAASTTDTNVGVIGIANGSTGIGLVGVTNGSASGGQADAIGVLALATSTTGTSTGLSAQISSPNGVAIEALTSSTGLIFRGESENTTTPNPKIIITALGQVVANGSVFAKGFQLNSGNFGVTENGTVSAFTLETIANLAVGGTLSGSTDTLQISNNINVPGNITSGGTVTPGLLGGGGNTTLCTLTGVNTIRFCSSSLRYKNDVRVFRPGLDIINRLRPVAFQWKENGENDMGLVAEEVNAVDPLLTTNNAKGEVEGVKYDRVAVVLVNAVKEQQKQIGEQQETIKRQQDLLEKQQTEIKKQQTEFDALKRLVCSQNPTAELCQRKN